jgi:hypothetical protein
LKRYLVYAGIRKPEDFPAGETTRWNFYEDWGLTLEEFLKHCHDGADKGFIFTGPTREGAVEAMNALHDRGHEIHIVTDRSFGSSPDISKLNTLDWLAGHGFKYHTITFSPDKTVVPTEIFIEDKLENYDALNANGTEVYLINRPWNTHVLPDNRRRVNTLQEFVDIILAKELVLA